MENPPPRLSHRQQSVVVMTAGGTNPRLVINALAALYPNLTVIQENPESKSVLIRRRAKHLGWIQAAGQLATMMVSRLGKNAATRRSAEIIAAYGLSDAADPHVPLIKVASLNDPQCRAALQQIKPAAILTASCRILGKATLAACPCPVINLHAGINPAYRGQMGGYWALAENDAANFGATLHLVDAGIDTGGSLYEVRPTPAASDSMMTYPLLLTAAAIPAVVKSIDDALLDRLSPFIADGPSKLRYNPAIWTWVWNGLVKGVW